MRCESKAIQKSLDLSVPIWLMILWQLSVSCTTERKLFLHPTLIISVPLTGRSCSHRQGQSLPWINQPSERWFLPQRLYDVNWIIKLRGPGYGPMEKSNYPPTTLLLLNKEVCSIYQPVIQVRGKEKFCASLRSHQMKQCNSSQEQGKSRDEIRTLWVIACSLFCFRSTTSVSYPLFKDIHNWIPCIFIKD